MGNGRGDGVGDGDGGPPRYTFIIDASGSLIEGLPFVIDALKQFVNEREEDEEFAIFFFQGGKCFQVVDKKHFVVKRNPAKMQTRPVVHFFIETYLFFLHI